MTNYLEGTLFKLYLFYKDNETNYIITHINYVGADDCACVVFMWEETIVQGGNPPAQLGDHMTISNATPDIELGLQW